MKKIILSIIAAVCCLTASADTTPATEIIGNKTFYKIGTLDELTWFANHVNVGNTTVNAILTADITMNEGVLDSSGNLSSGTFETWTPIGGLNEQNFTGEFNGNGHTISGLYFNSDSRNNVGIFGKAGGNAYIHDLGISDSYFYGLDHVGGICGDFASGRIENCWNGATIKAKKWNAGGISGSCYINASIKDCYNIGMIHSISDNPSYGGICGGVYKNTNVDYTISNCYTLEGKCEHEVYGSLDDGCPASKINHSFVKDEDAFASGEVCYQLNYGVTNGSQKWYQTLGTDTHPVLDNSRGIVFYGYEGDVLKYSNSEIYVNATHREVCAATCNAVGYTRECWEDTKSGKIYAEEACINELNAEDVVLPKTGHNPQHTSAKAATCTEKGNYEYWYCTKCKTYFANSECTTVMTDWEIPALGHSTTHNVQKDATCTEDGNIEYWHCTKCNLNYNNEACTNQITGSVVLQKIGHGNKEHHASVAATCLTDGSIEYWYCPDCETYFTNEACTASTENITIAALGHDFTYTPYKTSTCTSKGDVEHWHCNRCEKDFNTGEQTASEDHVISGSLTIPCKESDVILVGMDEGKIYDDCHTFTPPTEGEGETLIATVTFDGDAVKMKVKNGEETAYSLNENKPLETFFAHTFKLEANQDPDHPTNYYSTFYTSEGAYKVPADGSATAYAGTVESGEKTDVLKLADIGNIIHKKEAVILRASQSDITLMPSCNKAAASTESILEGTDVEKELETNQYALSLGQNGVGFYLWDGKKIGANKAYLSLDRMAQAKAFTFMFDNGTTTAIESLTPALSEDEGAIYNLNGIRVNGNYKGIVIKNGKKMYNK